MRRIQAQKELAKDILYICIGIAVAIVLSKSGLIDWGIHLLGGDVVASFTAGIFFTSAFTIAPASLALAHIADGAPLMTVTFWGGLGAMFGDLLLFLFIRDKFAKDLRGALRPSLVRHLASSFHFGFMKWLAPVLGAVIIASPLPDEFGLALMGLSRTRLLVLLPLAFVMNMIGVYIVASFAQLL